MKADCDSDGKASAYNVGDLGLTPGLGRSSGEGKGYPLQYPVLENFMDCKEMATHSSVLAWRMPGTGEPGGLPSLGLHRVGDG